MSVQQQQFEDKQKELSSLNSKIQQYKQEKQNQEQECKKQLKAMLQIIENKQEAPKSGRLSAIGFRKIQNEQPEQSLDQMFDFVQSGVDYLLKQKTQLELEEQVLDQKIKQLKRELQKQM